MDLRHLRCFVAVAEELHFGRAAKRLSLEPSSLSRIIRQFEDSLGIKLFLRTRQGTRLTIAGQVVLRDSRHIFALVDQSKANARAAARGFHGSLRIALSDGIAPYRLSSILARCRAEEPEVEIRLFEVQLSEQVEGLRHGLYDAGFAASNQPVSGLVADPVWYDPLLAILPPGHPLLTHRAIPLEALVQYPLVLWHPEMREGSHWQIRNLLQSVGPEPVLSQYAASHDVMFALVAAGYGLGLTCHEHILPPRQSQIEVRRLNGAGAEMATYLLRPDAQPHAELLRFMSRIGD